MLSPVGKFKEFQEEKVMIGVIIIMNKIIIAKKVGCRRFPRSS
jgi:hypothetical protein